MPLFKLKNPFEKAQIDKQDYLALTITPNTVIACIWNFQNEEINVLATSHKTFGSQETIVHEAAVAIDSAAEKSNTDVTKVVFGLSSYWFEDGKLKDSTAKMLKNLSGDLELESQAFVTLAIAVNHLLKTEDAVTPQAVLVGNFEDFTEVHLIKNDSVVTTKSSSGEITTHKIAGLIRQLKEENDSLPAKIIVYGQGSEDLHSKLKSFKWEDLFVHEPKIDIFDNIRLAKAVAFAQAADILGHDPVLKTAKAPEEKPPIPVEVRPLAAGFIEGEDVLKLSQKAPEEEKPEELAKPEEDAGPVRYQQQPLDPQGYAVELGESDNLVVPPKVHHTIPAQKLIPKFSFPKLPRLNFSPKKALIAISALVIILVLGFFIAGQTLTAAQVVVKANPKTENFDFVAKVITGGAGDIDKGEIPGQIVTGSAQNSQKAVATGNKKTGTSAKGQVKILNWDKQGDKTFAAGTEVITKDGIKFKLDSDVNVASRSATTPGEAKAAATASVIGPSSNINSGVDLTIVGFDEVFYSGVTDSAFTGGEEKQITVVSKDDVTSLEKSLTNSLTDKAKQDLESKTGGLKIYDESKIVKITKKQFDKKVDEEATLVNLDMSIDFQGIAFDENNLKDYLAKLTNLKHQDNQEALPQTIDIKEIKVKRDKDTLLLSGSYDAGLVPKIDQEKLKGQIAGKNVKQARDIVKAIGDIADVQFIFSPNIPFVDSIPRNKNKITIKITSS